MGICLARSSQDLCTYCTPRRIFIFLRISYEKEYVHFDMFDPGKLYCRFSLVLSYIFSVMDKSKFFNSESFIIIWKYQGEYIM